MSNDFEKVPPLVWDLFCDIMWASYGRDPEKPLLNPKEQMWARAMAWGWDPPLLEPGTLGNLTAHGLAYTAWMEWQGKAEAETPLDGTVYESWADVPAMFRDGGKPDGHPLTVKYLKSSVDWRFANTTASDAHKAGLLTVRVKVGQALAYLYHECLVVRDRRLRRVD
jgi:hypothetical protein